MTSTARWRIVGLLGLVVACAQPPSELETRGAAELSLVLRSAPADAACLAVKVEGRRTVLQRFDLRGCADLAFAMRGLPLGEDRFSARAYAETCGTLRLSSTATWLSNEVTTQVSTRKVAQVQLTMSRAGARTLASVEGQSAASSSGGRAQVTIQFASEPDAGIDAGLADGGADTGTPDAGPAIDGGNDGAPSLGYTVLYNGSPTFSGPSPLMDTVNDKLLVVASTSAPESVPPMAPRLLRCAPDGTNCEVIDISAGNGFLGGAAPNAVIDHVNQKLLTFAMNYGLLYRPWLYRCDLDGTDCQSIDLSLGRPESGFGAQGLLDTANAKILAVAWERLNENGAVLFRCELDGTNCAYSDLSAGQGEGSGYDATALIDSASGKLLVVTRNVANGERPSLFRCNLDGSGCTHTDISAGQGAIGVSPNALIDSRSAKLLVVATNSESGDGLSLFRCELDGTGCTHRDLTLGERPGMGRNLAAVIDEERGQLFVATLSGDWEIGYQNHLFRCGLDGTGCTLTDLSSIGTFTDQRAPTLMAALKMVIDTNRAKLHIVGTTSSAVGMYTLDL